MKKNPKDSPVEGAGEAVKPIADPGFTAGVQAEHEAKAAGAFKGVAAGVQAEHEAADVIKPQEIPPRMPGFSSGREDDAPNIYELIAILEIAKNEIEGMRESITRLTVKADAFDVITEVMSVMRSRGFATGRDTAFRLSDLIDRLRATLPKEEPLPGEPGYAGDGGSAYVGAGLAPGAGVTR